MTGHDRELVPIVGLSYDLCASLYEHALRIALRLAKCLGFLSTRATSLTESAVSNIGKRLLVAGLEEPGARGHHLRKWPPIPAAHRMPSGGAPCQ